MLNLIVIIVSIYLLVLIILSTLNNYLTRYVLLNKYKIILELFEHFLSISYKVIYDDQLISFVSSGMTVTHEQLEDIQRNFINLSYRVMGENNLSLFRQFFGSEKVLITNINLYIRKRIIEDELTAFIDKQSKVIEEGK